MDQCQKAQMKLEHLVLIQYHPKYFTKLVTHQHVNLAHD